MNRHRTLTVPPYGKSVVPGIRVTTVDVEHATSICTVVGELDHASLRTLAEELDATLDHGARWIVLDLMRLTSLGSAGLGLLLATSDRLRLDDGALAVVCDDPRTLRMLDVTGLARQFHVEGTVADAVDALSHAA